jgi:LysM repeat protein
VAEISLSDTPGATGNRYNYPMRLIVKNLWWLGLFVLMALLAPCVDARAAKSGEVTAFDLIIAMNTLRVSYGLPPLEEDPIIDAVAQSTADIMAANNMSSHIGDVRGRLQAAGYGGGATVWATENFAVGQSFGIDQIMLVWSDPTHMIPAVNPAYCNIGAGVAKAANGQTYYILQAAYTSAKSCGEYKSVGGGSTNPPGGVTGVSQIIVPVKIAAPGADGRVFHEVKAGQSLWAIAIAYKITIADLETWNNLSRANPLQIGQRLFIPGSNTKGYATPTPIGMIQVSTPATDGRIVHTVQAYNTLIKIADAYGTSVDRILAYNGLQLDWPLLIGQKLVINPGKFTPSPTPRPLTPIERLTPESDGRYYHTVRSGETLSWISGYYGLSLSDLIAWNGLNTSSVIWPGEKLLMLVTPPATETPIPPPATGTPLPTSVPATPTSSLKTVPPTSLTAPAATLQIGASLSGGRTAAVLIILVVFLAAAGLLLVGFFTRRKKSA